MKLYVVHIQCSFYSSIKFGKIPVHRHGQDGLVDPESIVEHITKNTVGIMPTQLMLEHMIWKKLFPLKI